MRIGVVFPQTEIGADPAYLRDYAQTAGELGYSPLLIYDHVIGANIASRPGWKPPYSHLDNFHEPLVLFGYLSGITKKIELVTGIIIEQRNCIESFCIPKTNYFIYSYRV